MRQRRLPLTSRFCDLRLARKDKKTRHHQQHIVCIFRNWLTNRLSYQIRTASATVNATMKLLSRLFLLFLGVFLFSNALAYGFPIENRWKATVVGTPPGYRAELPEKIPLKKRRIEIFDREVPEALTQTARVTLRPSSVRPGSTAGDRVKEE